MNGNISLPKMGRVYVIMGVGMATFVFTPKFPLSMQSGEFVTKSHGRTNLSPECVSSLLYLNSIDSFDFACALSFHYSMTVVVYMRVRMGRNGNKCRELNENGHLSLS